VCKKCQLSNKIRFRSIILCRVIHYLKKEEKLKKLISSLLIAVILTQIVGCYSYQEITKDEFIRAEDYVDLQVITKNNHTYKFDGGDYIVKEDSISGSGKIVTPMLKRRDYKDFNGSIYLGDIESLKFDSFNVLITIIGIAATAGIILWISSGVSVGVPLKEWSIKDKW